MWETLGSEVLDNSVQPTFVFTAHRVRGQVSRSVFVCGGCRRAGRVGKLAGLYLSLYANEKTCICMCACMRLLVVFLLARVVARVTDFSILAESRIPGKPAGRFLKHVL